MKQDAGLSGGRTVFDAFAYHVAFIGIVIGLGITRLLFAFGKMLMGDEASLSYAAYPLWIVTLLVMTLQYWYELFRYKKIGKTFPMFMLSLMTPILLYLVIYLSTSHIDRGKAIEYEVVEAQKVTEPVDSAVLPAVLVRVVDSDPIECGLEAHRGLVFGFSALGMFVLALNFHFVHRAPFMIPQNYIRAGAICSLLSAVFVAHPIYDMVVVVMSLIGMILYIWLYDDVVINESVS